MKLEVFLAGNREMVYSDARFLMDTLWRRSTIIRRSVFFFFNKYITGGGASSANKMSFVFMGSLA